MPHLAPQNTSWENTWWPLCGCPGGPFRIKTLIHSAVWHLAGTCGRFPSRRCWRREQLFPLRLYLNYSDENLMHWQKAGITSWSRGEEQIKDLWCMYNEVSCGRTIIPLPGSSVHTCKAVRSLDNTSGLLSFLALAMTERWTESYFLQLRLPKMVGLGLKWVLSIQGWPEEVFFTLHSKR